MMKSDMFIEEWRDIAGYEGLYQVSNLGRVRSLDRNVKHSKGGLQFIKGRYLTNSFDTHNYLQVRLSKEGKNKLHFVHRLVANAFLPNPNFKPCVNHLNECPWDNTVWNLEWCTHKENTNYGTCLKRISKKTKKSFYKPSRLVKTSLTVYKRRSVYHRIPKLLGSQ